MSKNSLPGCRNFMKIIIESLASFRCSVCWSVDKCMDLSPPPSVCVQHSSWVDIRQLMISCEFFHVFWPIVDHVTNLICSLQVFWSDVKEVHIVMLVFRSSLHYHVSLSSWTDHKAWVRPRSMREWDGYSNRNSAMYVIFDYDVHT